MNMYFLSIIDGINTITAAGFLLCVIVGIVRAEVLRKDHEDKVSYKNRDYPAVLRRAIRAPLICAVTCMVLGAIIPSRRDLTEAYVMVEGRKVATAEGLTAAVQRLVDIAEKVVTK